MGNDPISSVGEEAPVTLEPIVMLTLEAGRILMEAGAGSKGVESVMEACARGLGAERVDVRIGYASLAATISIGSIGITRMCKVGHLGVNHRLDQEIRRWAARVSHQEWDLHSARTELHRLAAQTPRHGPWIMGLAVGLACAAFGQLLNVDWPGTWPVFVAATTGQLLRRELHSRHVNVFIGAALVALISSLIGGLGARWCGSQAEATAMVASVLLLVPGVPAVNAQSDILEGHPTLGSARAVSVAMALVFVAAGLWLSQMIIRQYL